MTRHPEDIDTYIAAFPADVREILGEIRRTVRRALPDATETLRYGIPTFRLGEHNIVHFAAWQRHVSVYPVPDGDAAFRRAIEPFRAGKGTLRFRFGEPVPYDLIAQVAALLAEPR